jgi:hypothetical protein
MGSFLGMQYAMQWSMLMCNVQCKALAFCLGRTLGHAYAQQREGRSNDKADENDKSKYTVPYYTSVGDIL